MDDKMYCLRCKFKTGTVGMYKDVTIKKCDVVKGNCSECGRKKCKFVKKKMQLDKKERKKLIR